MSLPEAQAQLAEIENAAVAVPVTDVQTEVVPEVVEKVSSDIIVWNVDTSITTAEAQEVVDEINAQIEAWDPQAEKTLAEAIYDESADVIKQKASESLDEQLSSIKLPDVNKTKTELINKTVEDIEKISEKKNSTPEQVVEQLTEMFIEKEEKYLLDISLLSKKTIMLEKIVDKLTEDNNALKYDDSKVKITDDKIGKLVNIYRQKLENPNDESIQKKRASLGIDMATEVYSELWTHDFVEFINNKREASLRKIQGLSDDDTATQPAKIVIKETKRTVNDWYIIS